MRRLCVREHHLNISTIFDKFVSRKKHIITLLTDSIPFRINSNWGDIIESCTKKEKILLFRCKIVTIFSKMCWQGLYILIRIRNFFRQICWNNITFNQHIKTSIFYSKAFFSTLKCEFISWKFWRNECWLFIYCSHQWL